MLFPEEDAPLLKQWIIKRLENTSDADADVLADYVLALLRHDGDVEAVRQLCESEIPDFLKEDSAMFVQDVFNTILYRSYLPGYVPPRRQSLPFAPPAGPSTPFYGNLGVGAPLGPQNGSRKRSYQDRGDFDAQDRSLAVGGDPNPRAYKQPRRGGPSMGRGGFDNYPPRGGGGFNTGRPPMSGPQGFAPMPGMASPPAGMPPFDPNNPMGAILAMQQALGLPLPPGIAGFPSGGSPGAPPPPGAMIPRKKQKCRDYVEKGFCARGNTCHFEHGEHKIWVPPVTTSGEEYDPSTSLMSGVESNNALTPTSQFSANGRGRGRGGFPRGGGESRINNSNTRKNGRAEFSSDRPNYDKSHTTIVVENIPEEKFSEDAVREFFSEFGTILEVDMRPYKRLAIIKYDDWDNANSAYRSPKVIFDNRFVKVYWYIDQDSLPKPRAGATTNGSASNGPSANATPVAARATEEPEIDLEEFARKQAEAQKVHEEKMKKKQEMEAAKKELAKRQEELLKSQAEEKRKLMEIIAAKSAKSGGSPIKTEDGTPSPSASEEAQNEALKAQLAALQAEATSLGIFPGRGRGRGRGGYRGRGAFVPRGARGGFRGGRGAAPFASNGRTYNLDNRPKKVALTGIDFSDAEKDENLRQYLLGVGEYVDIEVTPSKTSVTFKDRFTAEKFMYGVQNGEIPSVGKVDMAWVQTPLPPVTLTLKVKTESNGDGDVHMDEGDVAISTSSPAHAHGRHEQHQENIDYDVADDNDWGIL